MSSKPVAADLRLQAVLAEYEFVSGLIPFYRSVETGVLSIMSVVLAALAGFIGTVNSQGGTAIDLHVQAAVVALSSWLMVLFTAIEVTALLRIKRASAYLSEHLYPRLDNLVGKGSMSFEVVKSLDLIRNKNAKGLHKKISNWARSRFVTSAPIVLGMGILSAVLPLVALILLRSLEASDLYWLVPGFAGGLAGLATGLVGYRLTPGLERQSKGHKKS